MVREFAIDVSNNNVATLKQVKDSGAKLLICKGTEGANFVDKTIAHHRQIANELGIGFGLYVFLHAASGGDQAKFFLEHAKPHKTDVVIIDSEPGGQDGQAVREMAARSHACAQELEKRGFHPVLYASSSYWTTMVSCVPELKRLKVWEAQYPGHFTRWSPSIARMRARLGRGVTVVMWQWTDSYIVDGQKFDYSLMFTTPDKMR